MTASDLTGRVVAATIWYWGARLLAGALLSVGGSSSLAAVVAWLGVAGAAWRLADDGGRGVRGAAARLPPALLVALPEAVARLLSRYGSAMTLGLAVDHAGAVGGALSTVAAMALLLTLLSAGAAALRAARVTSGWRRFPT